MRVSRFIPALAFGLCFAAADAAGQTSSADRPKLVDADVSGRIGWFSANKSELGSWNDWYNRSFFGGLTAGYYWTDHLKTEVDFGGSTEGEIYAPTVVTVGNSRVTTSAQHRFSTRTVSVGQQFQFLRNAWVHPFVGVGVSATWERQTKEVPPLFVFDRSIPPPRQPVAPEILGPETDVRVRPFVTTGFKAYVARRAFFRTDLRVSFKRRPDDALLGLGFGIDF